MIPFERNVRLSITYTFILLILSSISWYLYPTYQTFLAGYVLGVAFSIINAVIVAIKTIHVSEYALGQRKNIRGTGQLQRFLVAGFAGYVTIRFSAYFHYIGVIVGLMTVTILSLFFAILHYIQSSDTTKERGEK